MSSDGHVIAGPHGRIELPASTLASLVAQAAELVPGAALRRPRRGLDVEIEGERARVALELTAARRLVLPDLARDVQARVAEDLRTTAGLDVAAVDVSIEELAG